MRYYKVLISNEAKKDIFDATEYIKNKLNNPFFAKKFYSKIKDKISLLKSNPYLYAKETDIKLTEGSIRKVLVDNYALFFIIIEDDKTIRVLRVIYARKNWKRII